MSKTILTEEQEQKIIFEYQNGISKNQLSNEFNVSEGTIRRCLNRNNIKLRTIKESNTSKYSVDEWFFEKEKQSSNSAYVCGILASDGTVSSKENQISLELKIDDEEIIKKINEVIHNTRPLNYRIRVDKNPTVRLMFTSEKIKKDLSEYDIIPRKTYKDCDFTSNIKKEFFSDFIRGFQDGDGCITSCNNRIRWQLDGVSLRTFKSIQKLFKEYYDIDLRLREEKDERSTIQKYRLYTSSRIACKKIFDILYENSSCLKMERKYKKFSDLLKNE